MSIIISKLLAIAFVVIGLFALASVTSEAQAAGTLRLAFSAKRDTVTGEVVTRVNNWTGERFNGFVCVTEVTSSRSYHRGCLKPDLAPLYQGEPGAFQFGVTTLYGGSVRYTYQGADGVWRSVAPALQR